MDTYVPYIPLDRRRSLVQPQVEAQAGTQSDIQSDNVCGAALFADISGFTPLTEALTRRYGTRRGADELVRQINRVYDALIDKVHRYGGSVIGFSGDAITCWFDSGAALFEDVDEEALRATAQRAFWSACAIQAAMHDFDRLQVAADVTISLVVKTSVASGRACRYLVGDPEIQIIDVLAGRLLDRMAAGEQIAQEGETVLDDTTAQLLSGQLTPGQLGTTSGMPLSSNQRDDGYVVLSSQQVQVISNTTLPPESLPEPSAAPGTPPPLGIPEERLRPWLLPAIYQRLQSSRGAEHDRYLAEMRPATALFVRFGGLDYDDDANAGQQLDQYIHWAQRLLQRYEGSLIQITTGDKGSYFYATFGAPVAHEDDSARAAAAAIELLTPPAELATIQNIQIGIAQGRMRVGAYGSRTRRTYGVIGNATNLSARLMMHANVAEILISTEVADEIGHLYQLEDRGLVRFKGKDQLQQVYRVERRNQSHANQFKTLYTEPLVGRDAELVQIDDVIASVAQTGSGHILRIEGDAGVGKSHLAAIATEHAAENHLATVLGACQSTSRDTAYAPFRQIVRHLLNLPVAAQDLDEQQTQINQVHAAVEQMNPEWLLRLPLLGDLLGLPIPDNETTSAFDAQLRQEALTALTLELLRAGADDQPYLLLVEDVHWIDESSQNILVALGRIITETPILLLLVHRPQLGDRSQQNDQFLRESAELPAQTAILLDELSPEGSKALVQNRVHGPVAPLASELIYAQAQGNPFFTEELVDTLVESGRLSHRNALWTLSVSMINALHAAGCLVREEGEWILAPDAALSNANLGVPDTVHGIVLSRLDRLPEAVKLTVKVASVIGRLFDFDLLAQAHPQAQIPDILLQQIGTLEHRDFAQIEKPPPNHSYIFKHNITQEVVYGTLLDAQRKELHLRVAKTLEAQHPEEAERLAHHFYNSDLDDDSVRTKALGYLDAAGQRAKRDYANETALSYFDRALGLDQRWQWLKDKVEVLHILGRRDEEKVTLDALEQAEGVSVFDSAYLWGEYYEAIGEYESAEGAIRRAMVDGDERGVLRCQIQLADVALRQGDYNRAKEGYGKSLELASKGLKLQKEKLEMLFGLGIVERSQGNYAKAKLHLGDALSLCRKLIDRQYEAKILTALSYVYFFQRIFKDAKSCQEQALDIQHSIGDRSGEGLSLMNLAMVVTGEGDHGMAESLSLQSLSIQKAINNRWNEAAVWNALGISYLMTGSWQSARESFEEGLSVCEQIGAEVGRAHLMCNLAQVLRECHEHRTARKLLKEVMLFAQSQDNKQMIADFYSEMALIDLYSQEFDSAIKHSEEALSYLREMGLDDLETGELTTLAIAYIKQGNDTSAFTYAKDALRILERSKGEGIDYPHRDYFRCFQIFSELNEPDLANRALHSAHNLLVRKAQMISNESMRHSFLNNVSFNRAIIQEAEKRSMNSNDFGGATVGT